MKKTNLLLLFVLLSCLFSFSVLAAIPTPSDLLSWIKDLFTGGISWESIKFVSFVLYFIIFMAIFVEGLKLVAFFGGRGEINTSGKWFAFAASLLATIAVFFVEKSGLSTQKAVETVISPFGVWGILVLAAIVAFFAYRLVRDSGIFGDKIGIAIGLAIATGMIFAGWILNFGTLASWGFLIVLILLIALVVIAIIKTIRERRGEPSSRGRGEGSSSRQESKAPSPKLREKEEETEKKAGKLEEFAIAEYAWLKELKEEVEKSYDAKKNEIDTSKIKPRKEERNEKRMVRRANDFLLLLEELDKQEGITYEQSRKIDKWHQEVKLYEGELIAWVAKGAKLDELLKKSDDKFEGGGGEKYQELKYLLEQAIKADENLMVIFKEIKKDFKKYLEE